MNPPERGFVIKDYYLTPWDLGYGPFVKFDHDFIGREALEAKAGERHRRKVTLALDDVSVTDALHSIFDPEPERRAKFTEFPSAVYAMHAFGRAALYTACDGQWWMGASRLSSFRRTRNGSACAPGSREM